MNFSIIFSGHFRRFGPQVQRIDPENREREEISSGSQKNGNEESFNGKKQLERGRNEILNTVVKDDAFVLKRCLSIMRI